MLTMIHSNRARVHGGKLTIDRKFHVGMQSFVEKIRAPIVSIHPEGAADETIMDPIEVSLDQLGYGVLVVKADASSAAVPAERGRIREQIAKSSLVYGNGLGAIARSLSVPYIMFVEYDLRTQITVATCQLPGTMRKVVRAVRRTAVYAGREIPEMLRAHSLHCNGYPIYDETRRFNSRRLLYLDSRMSQALVIPADRLRDRLAGRPNRPLRLLYSGRYEAMKGAADAVRVGLECIKLGLDIELHCYGQGILKPEMERLAAQAPGEPRIFVHDAIPYPELVERSRGFDAFVCCHVQSDPSCTYLESFGSGLPIVGYDNRMWRRLSQVSEVGFVSPSGQPALVARDVQKLAVNATTLASMSERARQFAMDHCFEREYERRIDAINAALASSGRAPSADRVAPAVRT